MNKGQGFAMGAALVVALLLRPAGFSTTPGPETSDGGSGTVDPVAASRGVGPWIASCKYWAPARDSEPTPSKPPESEPALVIKEGAAELRVRLDEVDEKKDLACGGDPGLRWGVPGDEAGPINITAMIATVSDPVHTHLALTFDRTIDAILQAAGDNFYVSSYYWLPWKNHATALRFAESPGEAEHGHDPERERKPGLMILKRSRVMAGDSTIRVIYLFLVAETPTEGVDGFQLRNALQYEAELKSALGPRFSTGTNDSVTIIGPQFSGSAASLRAGIETARRKPKLANAEFYVMGATSTQLPVDQLETKKIHFRSFAENGSYDIQTLIQHVDHASTDTAPDVLFLIEDNTAFADAVTSVTSLKRYPVIRFPREISLLRNAQGAGGPSGSAAAPGGVTFSPYLHFSLKDYSAQDSVPQFSRDNTPLSQEAQLMAIARQARKFRFRYIAISGSNELDEIFLAQFLHRACPDARLVFFGADLLMVREIDNVPFIGSITITPYPLIGLGSAGRAYTDSASEAYYNAVSFTFWCNKLGLDKPLLRNYRGLRPQDQDSPYLWATAIGKDGYYPLSILTKKPNDPKKDPHFLPQFGSSEGQTTKSLIYPSELWVVLCAFICFLCLLHTILLSAADYWSPLTRDLAIGDNDQPGRRSLYINVATTMLSFMAFVVSLPPLSLSRIVAVNPASKALGLVSIAASMLAAFASYWKTREYVVWLPSEPARQSPFRHAYDRVRTNAYVFLHLGVLAALLGVPGLWFYLCNTGSSPSLPTERFDLLGMCFSYRSIHPGSGVSPVVPVLLLLFSWYLWGVFQTLRLRFSDNGRPRLPRNLEDRAGARLFVSDQDLEECGTSRQHCLYRNITCVLISRDMIRRFFGSRVPVEPCGASRSHRLTIDIALAAIYAGALVWLSLFTPMHGLDHFLRSSGEHLSCPYEFLVAILFFPLIAVSLTGWLRMILIWGALNRGVLARLENMPIRFAFSRLEKVGWMTMLRTSGLQEQWRDMSRGLESMRQMLHRSDLLETLSQADWNKLENASTGLLEAVRLVGLRFRSPVDRPQPGQCDYDLMKNVELGLAAFGQELLATLLIPYWSNVREGLVQSQVDEPCPAQPALILLAEEFLAIRYLSLIRSVLANLRYLMIFVSLSFVLAIWAWNSYPFQPSQLGDLLFTGLLAVLGSGVIWVFAQMHRNAILSRITETRANELGWDFYLRVISFGALPVITWLAYQFPDVGNILYKFLQPGAPVIK